MSGNTNLKFVLKENEFLVETTLKMNWWMIGGGLRMT